MKGRKYVTASFRDPSGFVFSRDGIVYRQINLGYKEEYDLLLGSGLYEALINSNLLVPHEETSGSLALTDSVYKVIKPAGIPFISYPFEWCFSQLRDAALTTLKIQKTALDFGMTLKDSSAYNIQFVGGKPLLIDTLSFEKYTDGAPWVAYRQFCQHFLAPLALMSYRDIRLNQLLRIYMDGIPLDLSSRLLPFRTRLKFSLLSHIHLHARSQKHFAGKSLDMGKHSMSRMGYLGVLDNLENAIRKLTWHPRGTEWADYYEDTNYSGSALDEKKRLVEEFLDEECPETVWDLGANTGLFSRIASNKGIMTIAWDVDPAAVEKNYLSCREKEEAHILPLILDLTNPTSAIGWAGEERMSFSERGPADTVLALALIHHLAIANNLPLGKIASFFSKICHSLIIEFVPKDDSQVQRLLASREDIFPGYNQTAFEKAFGEYFSILRSEKIRDSRRTLYLMRKGRA